MPTATTSPVATQAHPDPRKIARWAKTNAQPQQQVYGASIVISDDPAAITEKANTLSQASMKLGEAMYKQAQEAQPGSDAGAQAAGGGAPKDDVVDAEFTEVDDDKNNKKSA